MWFRNVDFPNELVEAHRAGRLVIFVGAGASRDAPSDLPDFRSLAAGIAADAHVQPSDDALAQPDVFLGELADRNVGVHRLVAARLGIEDSRPNRLHGALVDLAAAGPPLRIVTTNYDLHLSAVVHDRGIVSDEFAGPALPIGDDFEGLVYLHGNLRQDPRHLVVTDRDFGRAYLRNAWAARFLERMFSAYVVLFVGYSHGDIVMRYLARGLRGRDGRHVLTADPEAADWRRLGLHPVAYEVAEGSHAALADRLEAWAAQAAMGMLGHRQRVAELVAVPPSQVPEEASYLEALVTDPARVRLFAELARGEEWLAWAARQAEFRRLLDPVAAPTQCGEVLSYWFSEHFVTVEELSDAALRVVADAGGRLGPLLCSAIGHQLHKRNEDRPEWLSPWLVLLLRNMPENQRDWLEYALNASRWPADRPAVLLLFDHLTEPRAVWRPALGGEGRATIEVGPDKDPHWLQQAWQELLLPNVTEAAPELLAIADRHLRRARQLMLLVNSGREWDSVSFRRAAVEPHSQDEHRETTDVLIDAARDSLETLLDRNEGLANWYLNAWADSDVPILRRLAVHGWGHRTDVDATSKIEWVSRRGWLFDHQLRHEVFRLLAEALPNCDPAAAEALVAAAAAGPDREEDRHHAYERFNTLVWIVRHAPSLESAQDALGRVQKEHPDFEERSHPDLTSWMKTGWLGSQAPMTADELHDLIEADAAASLAELRRYEDVANPFEGPTWHDALSVLAAAVTAHPEDGFEVLDADGGDHPDVVGAVVRGWSAADFAKAEAEAVLERLTRVRLEPVAEDVSRLLADGGRIEQNPTAWHCFTAARRLAGALWAVLDRPRPVVHPDDWLGRAINNPAGRLAQFWVRAVEGAWRAAGDDWVGIDGETRAALDSMLDGTDDHTAMAEVVFASQALFFFAADRKWCEDRVLHLLDWENPSRARRTWDGFLTWGRWNDRMLSSGLLTHYMSAARNIGQLTEESGHQLCGHLAGMALTSELAPLDWIGPFTVAVEVDVRVEWMNQVAWTLGRLPAEAAERQWRRWMRQYWQGRLEGLPREMTYQEGSAMAAWTVHLADSVDEAVTLAMAHPAGLGKHADLLRQLDDSRLDRAPTMFARLIAHLLRHTEASSFWDCHRLAEMVSRLRSGPHSVDVEPVVEQALRLGCSHAAEW